MICNLFYLWLCLTVFAAFWMHQYVGILFSSLMLLLLWFILIELSCQRKGLMIYSSEHLGFTDVYRWCQNLWEDRLASFTQFLTMLCFLSWCICHDSQNIVWMNNHWKKSIKVHISGSSHEVVWVFWWVLEHWRVLRSNPDALDEGYKDANLRWLALYGKSDLSRSGLW